MDMPPMCSSITPMSTDEDSIQLSGPLPTQTTSTPRCSNFKNSHLNRASKVWEDRFIGNSTASHFSRYRTASQVIGKRHSFAGHHISSRFTSSESIPNNLLKSRSQIGSSLNSIKEHLFTMIAPDDNKLCLKFFGTKRAVHLEQQRMFNQQVWIIHPYSCFKECSVVSSVSESSQRPLSRAKVPTNYSFSSSHISNNLLIDVAASQTLFLARRERRRFITGTTVAHKFYRPALLLSPIRLYHRLLSFQLTQLDSRRKLHGRPSGLSATQVLCSSSGNINNTRSLKFGKIHQ
ncbi:Potassium/sodium hyperpolarization-activated cyclic nucleotide-gated channel 3 [Taenia crassiceps]|uniref:Potassium/sodium hyperpolarization-activated cyclic nucleotide-gated channel 3 n=1 Tax=Taenia crassiceps TaxID=6207 RepID=A0ABR4QC40_9CEST